MMTFTQWQLLQGLEDSGEIYALGLEQKEARIFTVQEYALLSIAAALRHLYVNVDTST